MPNRNNRTLTGTRGWRGSGATCANLRLKMRSRLLSRLLLGALLGISGLGPTNSARTSVGGHIGRAVQANGYVGRVVAKRSRRSMVRGSAMTSSPSNKIHDPTCRAENPANRKNFQSSRAPHTKGCNTVFVRPTAPKLLLKSRDPGATHLWVCVPNLWRLLGSGQKSHSRSAVT